MVYLLKLLNITNSEWKLVRSSFLYIFFLMSGYFILRPVRDEMGILSGVDNLQWLFTCTFITMILIIPVFGFLMNQVPRQKLLPRIYLFFISNIIVFYFLFLHTASSVLAASFFVWLSVFNLFVVSIFWSFNSDIFSSEQAKRLYAPIAAGGSIGATFGPSVATTLVEYVGVNNLLLISVFFLLLATYFLKDLISRAGKPSSRTLKSPGMASIWHGLIAMLRSPLLKRISIVILLYTSISTFLYFEQAHIVSEHFITSSERTAYFGQRDLLVNGITLLLQLFIAGRIIRKAGLVTGLILVPLVAVIGFIALSMYQSIITLLIFQVVYRSLNFAVQRPSREILFTRLSVAEKYNSKNFIDTVIYRGGDAISGWMFAGLAAIIPSLQIISLLAVPLAIGWIAVAWNVGNMFNTKSLITKKNGNEFIIAQKSA